MEKSSFCRLIEKRVRKDLRLRELFKKNDVIYVKDSLSRLFIDLIVGELPKKFTKDPKKANKIVVKYTMDDKCNDFIEKLFYKKEKKAWKGISVLETITDKEALLFARYNNIKFIPNKKDEKTKEMLDKLENMYPQTRFSISRSIDSLK